MAYNDPYNESDPRFGQQDPMADQQYPATSSGPTDWVPDGQGSWMPPQSSWPTGKVWDPKMANFVDSKQPPPPPQPPPTGGNLGSLIQPFSSQFTAPAPVNLGGPAGIPYVPPTPTFTPPSYTPPPAFSFGAFKGPDAQSVLNDPGYQFRLNQGEQALQQGAAAKGTLNGGATQKAILGYGQDYASNEFNNVWNRDLTEYNTNLDSALKTYATNYGSQYLDPYKFAYQGAQDAFAPQVLGYQTQAAAGQHQTDMDYANTWNQYLEEYNRFRDQRDSEFSKKFAVATA